MSMFIKKRQFLAATLVVALAAAVTVNWYYSKYDPKVSEPSSTEESVQGNLGDSLLVAPVFSEDGSVEYYLPQGEWIHYIDGRKIDCSSGGRWMKETYDFKSLPLWKKAGGKL